MLCDVAAGVVAAGVVAADVEVVDAAGLDVADVVAADVVAADVVAADVVAAGIDVVDGPEGDVLPQAESRQMSIVRVKNTHIFFIMYLRWQGAAHINITRK